MKLGIGEGVSLGDETGTGKDMGGMGRNEEMEGLVLRGGVECSGGEAASWIEGGAEEATVGD